MSVKESERERERDRIAWKFWPSFVLYCTIPSSMSGKYREARGVVSLNGGVFFIPFRTLYSNAFDGQ